MLIGLFIKAILFIYCTLFICSSKKVVNNKDLYSPKSGLLLFKNTIIDTTIKKEIDFMLKPNLNIWYHDSCLIIEKRKLNIVGRLYQEDTVYTSITGYGFIDIKKRQFRFYRHLSDTALPVKSYNHLDSVRAVLGRDPLYINTIPITATITQLNDTLIEGTIYKRTTYRRPRTDTANYFIKYINYYNCNAPTLFLQVVNSKFLAMPGCIITRYDMITDEQDYYISEMKLIREFLTEEEQKVFHAWRKF
jgi:hypothetical protein